VNANDTPRVCRISTNQVVNKKTIYVERYEQKSGGNMSKSNENETERKQQNGGGSQVRMGGAYKQATV